MAIGIMPAIIAKLVIRIGRKRLAAPSTAASASAVPETRLRSANVTSKIAFATATPIAMIAPMNDCRLSVVRVIQSVSTTPAMTAGIVRTTASDSRKLLKVGGEQQEDHEDRDAQAGRQASRTFRASVRSARGQ